MKNKKLEVPKDPNQRPIMQLFPKRKALRKSLAPTYYPIDDHIYYTGYSFRVRINIDGQTLSMNTPSKKKAIKYRNSILETLGRV